MKVKINNKPNVVKAYVVARIVNNELWFYGSYDLLDEAQEVSRTIGGRVYEKKCLKAI